MAGKIIFECELCGVANARFRCNGCKCVRYCKKEHSEKHWPQHKLLCNSVVSTSGELMLDHQKAALMYNGPKIKAGCVIYEEVSIARFYDGLTKERLDKLKDAYQEKRPYRNKPTVNELSGLAFAVHCLLEQCGDSSERALQVGAVLVTQGRFKEIEMNKNCKSLLKLLHHKVDEGVFDTLASLLLNSMNTIHSNMLRVRTGFSVEWLSGFVRHSCDPNCMLVRLGGNMALLALREVSAGTQLTAELIYDIKNYSAVARKNMVEKALGRKCNCELCNKNESHDYVKNLGCENAKDYAKAELQILDQEKDENKEEEEEEMYDNDDGDDDNHNGSRSRSSGIGKTQICYNMLNSVREIFVVDLMFDEFITNWFRTLIPVDYTNFYCMLEAVDQPCLPIPKEYRIRNTGLRKLFLETAKRIPGSSNIDQTRIESLMKLGNAALTMAFGCNIDAILMLDRLFIDDLILCPRDDAAAAAAAASAVC